MKKIMKKITLPKKGIPTLTYEKKVNLDQDIIKYTFKDIDTVSLMVFSDLHIGHEKFDEQVFFRYLKTAYEEPVLVLLNGDIIECGTRHSYGTFEQTMDQNQQYEKAIEYFQPLSDAGRLIAMISGNHENRLARDNNKLSINQFMGKLLKVPAFDTAAFIKLYMTPDYDSHKKMQFYQIYATHGKSWSKTASGKLRAVMETRDVANADLYIMSHMHTPIHHATTVFDTHGMKRVKKAKQYVVTGAFLQYWNSYAHKRNIAPSVVGVPKIKFHAKFHRISVRLGS